MEAATGEGSSVIECDVLVAGSGAAGLSAAIVAAKAGLSVVVAEKASVFGGTTALSGGGVWIPASRAMRADGFEDSIADAAAYLKAVLGAQYDDSKVEAYLAHANEAVDYLSEHAGLELISAGLPDYEMHLPGAGHSRCLLSPDFDGRKLGPLLGKLRPALREMGGPLGFQIGFADMEPLLNLHRSFAAFRKSVRIVARQVADLLVHGRATRLANGNALAARLLLAAADSGVSLWSDTPVKSLRTADNRVIGAIVERSGQTLEVRTSKAVIMATGGFGADAAMRREHIPLAATSYSLAPRENRGDGIRLALGAGGRLAEGNAANAIWTPMSAVPAGDGPPRPFPHLAGDRLKPGSIIVDADGRRFTDEANHYQAVGNDINRVGAERMFLVGDAQFLRRYGMGLARPAPWPHGALLRKGYLKRAGTVGELAGQLGIDPARLERMVATFNEHARQGQDPEFGRGAHAYSHFMGDPGRDNPSLAPLERAPFYAIELRPGDLCTLLGVVTDARAAVLDAAGQPIAGLYAVGLDMNSPWRGTYPGGGAALGPAIVFGYLAARDIVRAGQAAA